MVPGKNLKCGIFTVETETDSQHQEIGVVKFLEVIIRRPALYNQFALGMSGRVEYVMPFFTVGIGMGTNFIGKGDLRAFYQMLTLKIAMSRDTFLHVGYRLIDVSIYLIGKIQICTSIIYSIQRNT